SALQALKHRANGCEWPIFMLLFAEAVRVGAVRRIDWLQEAIWEILFEPQLTGTWLRDKLDAYVPGVPLRELRDEVVRAMRHIEMDEVCCRDEPVHSGRVVEAIR